jgi:hypothetical protein
MREGDQLKRTGLWDAWLLVVAFGMAAFGVLMALFSRSPLFDGFNSQIDPVFWNTSPIDTSVQTFQGWAYGVWGATVAGFGVLAAFVVRGPYHARQRWARDALVAAIAAWFILDTGVSALYGVWFNVAFNTAVLLALTVPIGVTWREFGG